MNNEKRKILYGGLKHLREFVEWKSTMKDFSKVIHTPYDVFRCILYNELYFMINVLNVWDGNIIGNLKRRNFSMNVANRSNVKSMIEVYDRIQQAELEQSPNIQRLQMNNKKLDELYSRYKAAFKEAESPTVFQSYKPRLKLNLTMIISEANEMIEKLNQPNL